MGFVLFCLWAVINFALLGLLNTDICLAGWQGFCLMRQKARLSPREGEGHGSSVTYKLFLAHTDEGKISRVKLDIDLDNVVYASLDKVSDDDIWLVRGAEIVARCNHKLESFFVCKLKGKSKQGSNLLAGVMAVFDDLAVELAIHVDALVNVGTAEVEASHMLPENFVEARLLVIELIVDIIEAGNCYCFGISKVGSVEKSGNLVESFIFDSIGKFFGCAHNCLLPSG